LVPEESKKIGNERIVHARKSKFAMSPYRTSAGLTAAISRSIPQAVMSRPAQAYSTES
jgi:hypothetical protein